VGTQWNIEKAGQTLVPDENKVTSLLADFSPLRADKYVDDKPLTGTPDVTMTITVVEKAYVPATATAPATSAGPATTTAPATGTAPAASAPAVRPSVADLLPNGAGPIGPDAGKLVTYTLKLYRQQAPATASAPAAATSTQPAYMWRAVWDTQTPPWTFEPNSFLVDHVTKEIYTPTPASQPAPGPGPGGSPTGLPPGLGGLGGFGGGMGGN